MLISTQLAAYELSHLTSSRCELLQADFSSNKFTGKIPSAFIQSDGLVYLNVSRNQLDGIDAVNAWSTPALVTFDASQNNIAGLWHTSVVYMPVCCSAREATLQSVGACTVL